MITYTIVFPYLDGVFYYYNIMYNMFSIHFMFRTAKTTQLTNVFIRMCYRVGESRYASYGRANIITTGREGGGSVNDPQNYATAFKRLFM